MIRVQRCLPLTGLPINRSLIVLLAIMISSVARGETTSTHVDIAVDQDGSLSDAEILERIQLLVWDRRHPLKPSAPGAIGAASASVVFGVVTGSSGAGQDLARPRLRDE